ncbi:unnamed protein product [Cunninghamella blakesleeana]
MVKVTSVLSIILASIALVQCAPADANDGNMMKRQIPPEIGIVGGLPIVGPILAPPPPEEN